MKPWRTQPLPRQWSKTRNLVLRRDGRQCATEGCDRPGTQVDHIVPVFRGGSEDFDNLQTLCKPCHSKKTSVEANSARGPQPQRDRESEPHPGEVSDT